MDALLQDIRLAVRQLVTHPGFTAVAVATLGLGIGATSAILSVVNGVLLRPLPYEQPERLVRIFETPPDRPDELRSVAMPTLAGWSAGVHRFDAIALYGPTELDLGGDQGRPEQLSGVTVSAAFFDVLRVRPALGRSFTPEEQQPGGPRVVILADGLWRRRFGADGGVIGRTLSMGGDPFTIIGVMPPGFGYPAGAEFWTSTALDAEFNERGARHLSAIARLSAGSSLEAATADLRAAERHLAEQYPANYEGYGVLVMPLLDRIVGPVRRALFVLLAAVGVVFLVACANVANLVLARAAGRVRELAVRTALGASRLRLARQLAVEHLGLGLAGGAVGVGIAYWGIEALRVVGSDRIPRWEAVAIDARVLTVALALAILTGLTMGLFPLVQAARSDVQVALRAGGRSLTAGARQHRVLNALVVAQTALALTLLASAGLLIRSFLRLAAVDPGVRTTDVLTFHVGLPPAKLGDRTAITAFYRSLRERLAAIPGVVSVATASRLPLSGDDHSSSFLLEGEVATPGRQHSAQDRAVSPAYFRTLGIPLRGREFSEADRAGGPPVVIINQTFARRFFPGTDPIGRHFTPIRAGGVPREIIGVAGDARQFGLDLDPEPEYYLPHAQDPWPWLYVAVHSAVPTAALLPALERAVWSLDPDMPVTAVRTMDQLRSTSVAQRRFNLVLLGVFAAVALLLACLGTYGVMAYAVTERTHEVGIRLALGARRADVLRLVLGRGLRLAAAGIALGLIGALAASRGLGSLLYGISATDPLTLAAAVIALAGAAVLASFLPARRAARVDPLIALRYD
jgi:putative ABC transport system permease protein